MRWVEYGWGLKGYLLSRRGAAALLARTQAGLLFPVDLDIWYLGIVGCTTHDMVSTATAADRSDMLQRVHDAACAAPPCHTSVRLHINGQQQQAPQPIIAH